MRNAGGCLSQIRYPIHTQTRIRQTPDARILVIYANNRKPSSVQQGECKGRSYPSRSIMQTIAPQAFAGLRCYALP